MSGAPSPFLIPHFFIAFPASEGKVMGPEESPSWSQRYPMSVGLNPTCQAVQVESPGGQGPAQSLQKLRTLGEGKGYRFLF